MRIPMTDLTSQYASIKTDVTAAIERVTASGRFILGPELEAFEKEMAAYCRTRFAVGVASGSDALVLALLACGVKPGDEVITTPFTFIATAMAISRCGATPVFADIDPRTFNIDPERIEPNISLKTRTIIPVHLFGQPADMGAITELAQKHGLKIIEDCAQALSAEYRSRKAGSIGDAGCLSFFPSKNLGAYGDGGMVVTNDREIAENVRTLRQHGARTAYYHSVPGFNSRLDEMQAAILRVKLKHLDSWSALRRQKAALYDRMLGETEGLVTPCATDNGVTAANYYTVRLPDHNVGRDELRLYLASKGIETSIYYPLSLHLQDVYRPLSYRHGDFPESELAQAEVLSLPMFPELADEAIMEVAMEVNEFCSKAIRRLPA